METPVGHSRLSRVRRLNQSRALRGLGSALTLALTLMASAGCDDNVLGDLDFSGPLPHVRFTGGIENADGVATISTLRVLLNGVPAQVTTLAQAAVGAPLSGYSAAGRGEHRLSIVMDSQTVSPSLYRVTSLSVQHEDSNGRVTSRITLDPRTASLRTGEAIEYAFTF